MVDDDEGDTLMAQEALLESELTNTMHIVRDGIEAIEFLEKRYPYNDAPTPDIILLDLNMPRMNGHEVLSWIRDTEEYKLTPVVVLTTSDAQQDIVLSYEKNANCYITKPVELSQFNKVLQSIDEFWSNIVQLPPQM